MELSKPEIYAILGTLVTVIGALWTIVFTWFRDSQKKIEKYEKIHEDCHRDITRLTGELEFVKGEIRGISDLSNAVLKEIRELSRRNETG